LAVTHIKAKINILNFHQKTPPTWLSPTMIAATHHHPPWFRRKEVMVKGTGMGCRNFLLAEIGHCQLQQPANTGTVH
jgi:hypothetical protein